MNTDSEEVRGLKDKIATLKITNSDLRNELNRAKIGWDAALQKNEATFGKLVELRHDLAKLRQGLAGLLV